CLAARAQYASRILTTQRGDGHASHAVIATSALGRNRRIKFTAGSAWRDRVLEIPALRVGDEKVAKSLHARDGLELFGINEIGLECDCIGLAEKLHEPAVPLDQIIRQHRDTEPALACAKDAENVVDNKMRRTRPLAVARDLDQPTGAQQVRRYVAAEHQNTMAIEIVDRSRRAEALEVFGRGVNVEVHGEQLALDQVGLRRLAQTNRDVGLAHGEVE